MATQPAAADMVNHPPHYTEGKALGWETIDVIHNELGDEGFAAYLKGQAIRYLSRVGKKWDASEDARKAAWYANRLAEHLEATAQPKEQ